ncbi:MAG: L-threonylcarbamoyladenylate synthase [Sphaerochaetaceae bacterium]|nr:L-threonylcarbamoyladenylate synthase [Sphaerochaetaceae bacterium]
MILNQDNYLDYDLKGKIIAFPTDTVYGIGCLYEDESSIMKIYDIKGRDYSKPMVILCSNLSQVKSLIKKNSKIPDKLIKHWPGKLTIIFFKNEKVYDIITSGMNTVGIRIPGNKISLDLLNKYGPMVVTSLNYSKEPAITNYQDVLKFEKLVDYIIPGGDLSSVPSTVYDSISDRVLRQGDIIIGDK